MFVCEKNLSCIGCNYQYADRFDQINEEFRNCGHLIEVQKVRHAIWMTEEYMYGTDDEGDRWVEQIAHKGDCAYCSLCKHNAGLDGGENYVLSPYCPHCGAKMDLTLI